MRIIGIKFGFLFIAFISSFLCKAQGIGHTNINFKDPIRTAGFSISGAYYSESGTGRNIGCEIYYPAATTGDNVAASAGTFPVLIFGHGFAMTWDAYQNLWQNLVPQGYIMVFPRTEGSLIPAPNHVDFGKDLRLLVSKMQTESNRSGSILFQKISGTFALMGHSMGGGASIIGGTNNTSISTIVNFAAAKTNPTGSSTTNAGLISVPVLYMSGQNDGVAPAIQHQDSMYFNTVSTKAQIYIKGGGHCYFANSNFNCDFGESTSSPQPTITRAQQQDVNQDLIVLWLNYYLKNDNASLQAFKDSLCRSARITYRTTLPGFNCNVTGIEQLSAQTKLNIFPNPAGNILNFELPNQINDARLFIYNQLGEEVLSINKINGKNINISQLAEGHYFVKIFSGNTYMTGSFVKIND